MFDRIVTGVCFVSTAIMALLGQAPAPVPDSPWTAWAGLPFAAAAAAFLTWSLVQLTQVMFTSYKSANSETISVLRLQVNDLRQAQQEMLVSVLTKATAAMQSDSDANMKLVAAWSEMHQDLRSLLEAVHSSPCLLFRSKTSIDKEMLELIQLRHQESYIKAAPNVPDNSE